VYKDKLDSVRIVNVFPDDTEKRNKLIKAVSLSRASQILVFCQDVDEIEQVVELAESGQNERIEV